MKLHIGSGTLYRNGYINIDPDPLVKADYHCSALEMPFEDNTFDEVYSHHALEHTTTDLIKLVDEMARVSKNGCLWEHVTPYYTWPRHLQNPHHLYKWWGEDTFKFFGEIYKRGHDADYRLEEIEVDVGDFKREIYYKLKVIKW